MGSWRFSSAHSTVSSISATGFNECFWEKKVERSATEDDLFKYTAQRWLWNERDQLQRRYLRFDLKALIKVAEDAAGAGSTCAEVSRLPEGNFNKTFLVKMQNGREVIARLPNPNAGRSHYTTASEVATMDYMRDRLKIPSPNVLAYSTQASANSVGAEYIIMDKCPGIELGRVWDDLPGKKRIEIVRQLAGFTARLSKAPFPAYGSLYYSKDISDVNSRTVDDIFSVGPTVSRTWFDDKRAEVDVHRGPWSSAEEVVNAIINREVACLNTFSEFPRDRQQGIFNGPGGFRPSKTYKMSVIEDVRRILPYIIPKDDAYTASIPWHNDLHTDNIFVSQNHTTEVTGIIDWQGAHLSPAFLHVHYPSLIEYDGPILAVFEQPQLPSDFADLDPVAKKAARELHTAQSIWGLYQIFTQKQAPDLLRTLRYRDTLPCQIIALVGSIFDDGEIYIQSLLSQLAVPDIWKQVVRSDAPCPLAYSEDQLSKQKNELAKWERDIERKARVIAEVGAYTGWDGAVSPEEFDTVSHRLEEAKKDFLNQESESVSGSASASFHERQQWETAWPFQDDIR
ncbi:kinase-like protein [Viridothelium virens]|uniref:Altered inheritance of mitochondria protein 9, mitochondrial n=1 Tax=Viridothelium virens TaxID=1048519 RepID=A0A6A6GWE1_VIRVR|nr:kinase-like protein [Viridothelium virens]